MVYFYLSNTNPSRNIDLQLPNDDSSSRRSSYGSDSEGRLPSGKSEIWLLIKLTRRSTTLILL